MRLFVRSAPFGNEFDFIVGVLGERRLIDVDEVGAAPKNEQFLFLRC